jgi:hypothetical protein
MLGVSAAAVVVIGLGWLLLRFKKDLPAQSFMLRAAIVLMFMGSSALIGSAAADWASSQFLAVANWFGGVGSGVVIIGTLFLLVKCAVGFWKKPKQEIAYIALVLPLILGLFSSGFLHDARTALVDPAQSKVEDIQSQVGDLGR